MNHMCLHASFAPSCHVDGCSQMCCSSLVCGCQVFVATEVHANSALARGGVLSSSHRTCAKLSQDYKMHLSDSSVL